MYLDDVLKPPKVPNGKALFTFWALLLVAFATYEGGLKPSILCLMAHPALLFVYHIREITTELSAKRKHTWIGISLRRSSLLYRL